MAKRPGAKSDSTLDESCRIVVLHGEEAFLRGLYTDRLREALSKAHGEVDVVTFDGATASAADVLDECRSFGLMAAHKLVIVDHAEQIVKEDNRALFERYAQAVAEAGEAGATLVLRADTWRAGKLDAMVQAVGRIIECDAVPVDKAVEWAVTRCRKEHGGEVERAAAERLVERVGTDLARIDSELGKLSAAAGTTGGKPNPITPALVAEFVGRSREEEVWSIQGVMVRGGPGAALAALHDALEVSRHPPALVFFAMADLARKLHACAHAARAGANFFQVRGSLRLWGPGGEAIFGAAKAIAPARARGLMESSIRAMVRDRTGLGEGSRTLEMLALEFAAGPASA